jgi:hypothetical protein
MIPVIGGIAIFLTWGITLLVRFGTTGVGI